MHISNASHGVHDPADVLVLYLGNKFFGKVILDALKRVTDYEQFTGPVGVYRLEFGNVWSSLQQLFQTMPMNPFKFLAASLLFVGCSGSPNMKMNDAEAGAVPKQDSVPRKIIYTASLDLVVDDLPKAEEEVNRLVQAQGGYVAKSEVRGSPGMPRSGSWTVRIPVENFKAFLDAAGKLGELTRSKTDSDDITDKYHDLQAHLKNNQVEEEGLRKVLLEKSANGKLEDVLAVSREIRAIRGEIDAQQGQILRWDKETAFTTITLNISDRKGYVPPTAPSLRTSIGRTFENSVDALADFGRGLLLAFIAIVPWLPLIVAGLLLIRYRWRRRRVRITSGRS